MAKKKDQSVNYYLFSILVSIVVLLSLNNLLLFSTKKEPVINIESNSEVFDYWQAIITEYPSYKDGYLALAKLHLEAGNTQIAGVLITEARKLSPNEDIILPR